jgi:hypothetical protein
MPGARRARSRVRSVESTRVSHHGHTGITRHSPRNGFTAYSALSLVTGLSCHHRRRKLVFANLTPASGRQDHTTSPSASSAIRQERISVHRIPPHVRGDRETPLCRGGTESQYSCFYPAVKPNFGNSEIKLPAPARNCSPALSPQFQFPSARASFCLHVARQRRR